MALFLSTWKLSDGAMRILVCIKEIENPEIASSLFRVDESRNEVIPLDGMALVTSPFDEQAIEAALRIRDQQPCQVTVLTFGPANAKGAIKRALSMGADDGIHVLNSALENVDSVTTARVLARAIQAEGPFDLILTGRQAADWDAGIVGCGVAQLLKIPVLTFAKSVRVEGDGLLCVERVVDDGTETVEVPMPCVVTVSNELGDPRKASLKETMRAAKKPTKTQTAEGLGMEPVEFVAQGARRQVRQRLFIPRRDVQCEVIAGASAAEAARQVISKLIDHKLI
jgi:electron transfer flavoprotein beta subunit